MVNRVQIVVLAIASLLAAADAPATTIFVNNVPCNAAPGNGTAGSPFRTITRALDRARTLRFGGLIPANEPIIVHVARGTYTGTFAPSPSACQETLPLLLNVPHLTLRGSPTSSTTLRAETRQLPKQHLLVVTRTKPTAGSSFPPTREMAGNFVSIERFTFEGVPRTGPAPDTSNAEGSALVSIDGVTNVRVSESRFQHAGAFGITARLSSGRIEGNQFTDNRGVGLNVSGGSDEFPARLEIVRNVLSGNGTVGTPPNPSRGGGINLQGAAQTGGDRPDLFGTQPFRRVPLPEFYDRTEHPEAVPDKLDVSLTGNSVSLSATFGVHIHGYIRDNYRLDPLKTEPMTANVRARFLQNVFRSNANYGIVIDAGQIRTADKPTYIVNVDAAFSQTTNVGSGSGDALFGFWRFGSSISDLDANNLTFKFAHDSTMTICGDVRKFSFENREQDPTDHTATNNVLTVNGIVLPKKSCVPLDGCVKELPPASGCD